MSATHVVRKLWIRSAPAAPMQERNPLELVAGRGVVGDHKLDAKRHVTIVFEDDWQAAAAELGHASLDPAGRRANVLVSGGDGQRFVGRQMRLGSVRIDIRGIVAPCPVMEQAAVGMHAALEPHGRAGIWGVVLDDGAVEIGQELASSRGSRGA